MGNILKFDTLNSFLRLSKRRLAQGPIALIFVEDDIEIRSTIAHHLMRDFRSILVFVPKGIAHPDGFAPEVHSIRYDTHSEEAVTCAINRIILWAPDTWMYYCYNAEYLFYPFCETRSIRELLAFNTQEERAAMLTYTIDLYAADLSQNPNAVCTQTAQIDSSGYYAQTRVDPDNHNFPKERQLDFFGGLRWRFDQYVPNAQRKIDRVGLFKSKPGLQLHPDDTFNEPEYNTYTGLWHNSPSAAILSFRAAKALLINAASCAAIDRFDWPHSVPFKWHSEQLLALGLMETGQWF